MDKTTEVVAQDSKELQGQWSREQVELIKSTVALGATDNELKLFLYTAKRTGLDPLTKQIHFVKRQGRVAIQTGIDGYRAIAERSKTLAGIDDAVYEVESETGKPKKASVTVYRLVDGQRVGFTASARWSEYAPQGNQAFMWNKMPFLMLGKCAEALALRKAFPNDLTGIYTDEEMHQAGVSDEIKVEEPKKFHQPDIKTSISAKVLVLRSEANKDNIHAIVKELTGLELVAENYEEINSRLALKVSEVKETKNNG